MPLIIEGRRTVSSESCGPNEQYIHCGAQCQLTYTDSDVIHRQRCNHMCGVLAVFVLIIMYGRVMNIVHVLNKVNAK
ncbi:unnamed protein product [Rotaria socialis]